MTIATAIQKDGQKVDYLPDIIGEGTMKQVYFTRDRKSVVCFYKDSAAATDPGRLQRLDLILTKYNPTIPKSQGGAGISETEASYFKNLYCWPTSIVTKPRLGFVAPAYPNHFIFKTGPEFIKGHEKNGMWFIGRKTRPLLEKLAPAELGTWLNYFKLCIQMARAVARLHTAGLAHSDLSPNNVLVDPADGSSIIIDIDSLVVEGRFPPDVSGTKGYIAPEVLATMHLPLKDPNRKLPNARTDLHALAVLIYQYLLLRHPLDGRKIPAANTAEEQDALTYGSQALFSEDPTDPSNRPDEKSYVGCASLGPALDELFQRAFVRGLHAPSERPNGLEWLRGLIKTWDMLVPCPGRSCPARWFVLHSPAEPRCPFCQTKLTASFPILKFRTERRPGQWMPDGQLVVYDQMYIFKWHAFDNVFPGPEADRTPQAYCAFHGGQWILVNQNLSSLTSPGGNRVPPGQAVLLSEGAQIKLSQEPHGRIADVHIVRV
jgi:serine/threonine protein kinase